MKIIVDVNVILSALIRDSFTRKLIIEAGHDLYFPKISFEKLFKYKDYVIKKSGLSEEIYTNILKILFRHIRIISTEKIMKSWKKAKRIMEDIDREDVIFIAAALEIDSAAIWSDDRDFEKQNNIKILKTRDMAQLFSSRSNLAISDT